jgi:hypothetical protein
MMSESSLLILLLKVLMSSDTTPITTVLHPLVDEFGKVLPHTPPSPTPPPPTLLFSSRVETPASWPPSDDMGIETHTPSMSPVAPHPLVLFPGHLLQSLVVNCLPSGREDPILPLKRGLIQSQLCL